jgi:hypothetical protein
MSLVKLSLGIIPLVFSITSSVAQELRALDVDLNDPEIRAFRERGAAPAAGQPEFPKLDIPIRNLIPAPSSPDRPAAPSATCPQKVSYDEDPRWYAVQHTCPKMVITITADRRYQGDTFREDRNRARGPAAAAYGAEIVPASGDLRDDSGLIASMTTYNYPNIPYHVTVECTEQSRTVCMSRKALAGILKSIGLVSVPQK